MSPTDEGIDGWEVIKDMGWCLLSEVSRFARDFTCARVGSGQREPGKGTGQKEEFRHRPGARLVDPIPLRVGLPGRSPDLGFSDETVLWNRATLQKLN